MVRRQSLARLTVAWASLAACIPVLRAAEDDVADAVSRLARIGSAYSPTFAPDGRTLAFVSDLSGSPQVWAVPFGGGWPRQVTAFDDQVAAVSWSPAGEWLAVSVAPGGGMNQQILLVSPDGVVSRRITQGGRENNWLGPWSPDGKSLAFSSNTRSAASMDVYLYELGTGETRLVAQNPGTGRIVDISRDGTLVLLDRLTGRGRNDLFVVETATGAESLLTPHEGPGSFAGELAADGSAVYLASDAGRDLRVFGRLRLQGGKPSGDLEVLAERAGVELDGFALSPRDDQAALVWNVAGRSEVEMLDLGTGARRPVDLSVDLVGGVEFAKNGRALALVGSGAAAPSDVYVLDFSSGRGRQLTFSPHPGVDLSTLVRPELVRYEAHDGLELSGWLYRPPGVAGEAPYVLSFHGGPEGQERPSLRPVYQALLQQGIGVFAPNIRGSSGFGKRFVNLDNRELRFDANRDIASSAEYLLHAGIAAPGRLGITGGSYGGYAVMVGVTEYPDLFAAGVNLFGIVNFETFFEHTEPWMAAISGTEYGDPQTQRDLLRQLSPIHKLERVKAPLLVLHGANDTNVPVVEAEQVVETLRKRGVEVGYVLFPDEGHGFRLSPNRVRSTVATVDWFRRHLLR
jgi:dipeptidyl aminopeptidase/acylaminoacyl peptidase